MGKGKRRRPLSDFGRQLLEKQRLRYTYGITERQLSRYVEESTSKTETNPGITLLKKLELRLDNVMYRSGLASTRRLARQIVSHGHITVNGKRVTVPSYKVKSGDTFEIREKSKSSALFGDLSERLKDYSMPSWIAFDAKTAKGTISRDPEYTASDVAVDLGQVLEFYSR
tara:strand:+ start:55037 stop:55546 length:510 start_codon:yes stop_codon:yes gene_type:complete